eukprot:TRINITY_DN7723_c0_g1_i1.p1 TRINITY_DN7723_c0_g1~~TRINITY_DN7723_c0_g1_i1.p1  ORF type:complete len:167 (-),score=50.81 TRINITY_DN7723_c0_g1_i1:225-677(-)
MALYKMQLLADDGTDESEHEVKEPIRKQSDSGSDDEIPRGKRISPVKLPESDEEMRRPKKKLKKHKKRGRESEIQVLSPPLRLRMLSGPQQCMKNGTRIGARKVADMTRTLMPRRASTRNFTEACPMSQRTLTNITKAHSNPRCSAACPA